MASNLPPRPEPEGDGPNVTVKKKTETTTHAFTELYDVDEPDFKYEPPKKDKTLPDLQRLLQTLESEGGDLDTKKQPPSLFTRPQHVHTYQKISELKLKMEEEEMSPYLDHFESGVRDDVVMLGSISLEDVQQEEKHLRDEHVQYLDQEARETRHKQEDILGKEEEAKKRVAKYTQIRREEFQRREEILKQKERLLMDRLHQSFRRAESQLISILEHRKGEVKTFYGDLMMTEHQFGGTRGRRWKVDWNRTPQPVQVKLKCLRGVKDKLPGGKYVIMISLYDRLGGNIMRWSKLKGQHWGGATMPVHHDGFFFNVEMKMDQSVFTVLPSKLVLKPGMVLIFELFLLKGAVLHSDRVVAWGCFPICDSQFEIIEGRYKVPFLRGEVDPSIEKHETIEKLIATELDHWLCNLYIEIVKLPRYLAGMNEFETELEFSSAMTAYPDRRRLGEIYRDLDAPMLGSQSDLSSEMGSRYSLLSAELPPQYQQNGLVTSRTAATVTKIKLQEKEKPSTIMSRKVHKDKKISLFMDESDAELSDPEDVKAIMGEGDFKKVKRMPGMYYKTYEKNPVDAYHDKLFSVLPKTAIIEQHRRQTTMTHLEELEQHTFSVQKLQAMLGRPRREGHEKLQYVGRQFLSELGLDQWRGREFWAMLIILVIVYFIRMYVHYIGQWALLTWRGVPINMLNFLPYTVELNYQPNLLESLEEVGVVAFGPLTNLLAFLFLMTLCAVMKVLFTTFPNFVSKFVMAYGIMTFLDQYWIIIVDCIIQSYKDDSATPTADFAKLWYNFAYKEGDGLIGIFLTAFIYLFFSFITGAFLYMYFLRLHNNGRLLDVYWRLRCKEETFFLSYDLEISNQELHNIISRAEQWRGEEGERRKVAVFDYIWEEEEMHESVWNENTLQDQDRAAWGEARREITTHVSIHTVHLDGLRELYRQFLRLPDGSLVEVFGDLSIPGMDKDIKAAMARGTQGIERLMGSQTSLNQMVRGRETVMTRSGFRPDERASSSNSDSGASSLPKKKAL